MSKVHIDTQRLSKHSKCKDKMQDNVFSSTTKRCMCGRHTLVFACSGLKNSLEKIHKKLMAVMLFQFGGGGKAKLSEWGEGRDKFHCSSYT